MKTFSNKSQENKTPSDVQGDNHKHRSIPSFQFVDNRSESITQREMLEKVNNNPKIAAQLQLQNIANSFYLQSTPGNNQLTTKNETSISNLNQTFKSQVLQCKWIIRDGKRIEIPDDEILKVGDRLAPREELNSRWTKESGLSEEEFKKRRAEMRQILSPKENKDEYEKNEKYAFPFSHFDNAFIPIEDKVCESCDVGGAGSHTRSEGKESVRHYKSKNIEFLTKEGKVTESIKKPEKETEIERIIPMLPSSLTEGKLDSLLRAPDPGTNKPTDNISHTSISHLRETMVGEKFARESNLDIDPENIHRPTAAASEPLGVDFLSNQKHSDNKILFDPFSSPQPNELSDKAIAARQALDKKFAETKNVGSNKALSDFPKFKKAIEKHLPQEGKNKKEENEFPSTYSKHTEDKKAGKNPVIGVWDQTSDSPEDIKRLENLKGPKENPGRVAAIDLELDSEFVLEDALARQQLNYEKEPESSNNNKEEAEIFNWQPESLPNNEMFESLFLGPQIVRRQNLMLDGGIHPNAPVVRPPEILRNVNEIQKEKREKKDKNRAQINRNKEQQNRNKLMDKSKGKMRQGGNKKHF